MFRSVHVPLDIFYYINFINTHNFLALPNATVQLFVFQKTRVRTADRNSAILSEMFYLVAPTTAPKEPLIYAALPTLYSVPLHLRSFKHMQLRNSVKETQNSCGTYITVSVDTKTSLLFYQRRRLCIIKQNETRGR